MPSPVEAAAPFRARLNGASCLKRQPPWRAASQPCTVYEPTSANQFQRLSSLGGQTAANGGEVGPGGAAPGGALRCNGARCSLARESPSRPSAQRSPIPPPSSAPAGSRAHCQFTDDKPFRVNSRRTARQPRWCFRASELSRPASSRVEKGSEANQAELHQLFNGKMNNKPIMQG